MNTVERVIRTAITLGRVGRIVAERKVQRKPSRDSLNPVFLLMFRDYHKLLDIQEPRSRAEASGITDFGMMVSDYIFWCDGYLDSQPLGEKAANENFSYKGASHQERLERVEQKAKELLISPDKINKIIELLRDFRQNVWAVHWSFFPAFNPFETSVDRVSKYVSATTGATADVLIRVLGVATNVPQLQVERAAEVGRQQANAFQMTDDLVDSVGDLGKRINLFNASLLESPEELKGFSNAAKSPSVLMSYRPFRIASIYAPNTLKAYMQEFYTMVAALPTRQRSISIDFMATGSSMSFTPQSETSFNPISLFLPKTKIDD